MTFFTSHKAKWIVCGPLMAVILLFDQVTKQIAYAALKDGSIEVLPFFNLVLVWNRGVSFGMMQQADKYGPYILSVLSLAIAVGLFIWLMRSNVRLLTLALAAVIAGAVGNVIDRLTYGAVIDFLDFHAFGYHWPAFNIADSSIVIGIAIIAFDSVILEPKRSQDTKSTEEIQTNDA